MHRDAVRPERLLRMDVRHHVQSVRQAEPAQDRRTDRLHGQDARGRGIGRGGERRAGRGCHFAARGGGRSAGQVARGGRLALFRRHADPADRPVPDDSRRHGEQPPASGADGACDAPGGEAEEARCGDDRRRPVPCGLGGCRGGRRPFRWRVARCPSRKKGHPNASFNYIPRRRTDEDECSEKRPARHCRRRACRNRERGACRDHRRRGPALAVEQQGGHHLHRGGRTDSIRRRLLRPAVRDDGQGPDIQLRGLHRRRERGERPAHRHVDGTRRHCLRRLFHDRDAVHDERPQRQRLHDRRSHERRRHL